MRRLAGPMLLCAALNLPLNSMPGNVLTIVQRDGQRSDVDPPSVDVSADGRYVAFTSYARLVPDDTNDTRDVYLLDRATGSVTLESVASGGIVGTNSDSPDLSGDGRFLVYETQLIADNAEPLNVVLRDRRDASVRILSKGVAGERANGPSRTPAISSDGRLVAFSSAATNLVPGTDANGAVQDIYTVDVLSGFVRRISAPGLSMRPSVSATGRYVAFGSVDVVSDVHVHDTSFGITKRVSVGRGGARANAGSWSPTISGDGEHVAFVSAASNLVREDDNQLPDVYVTEWQTGLMELVSRTARRRSGNDASHSPAISADGRWVAFQSEASNLSRTGRRARAMEDINLLWDVFLLDRRTGSTARVSEDETGPWMEASVGPALDAHAHVLAFSSRHPMDGEDRHNDFDLFIVTR